VTRRSLQHSDAARLFRHPAGWRLVGCSPPAYRLGERGEDRGGSGRWTRQGVFRPAPGQPSAQRAARRQGAERLAVPESEW